MVVVSSRMVHCWADLQSMHGFRCYDIIAPNAKCKRLLVLALCLVILLAIMHPVVDVVVERTHIHIRPISKTASLAEHLHMMHRECLSASEPTGR